MTRGLGGSLLPYRVRDFHSLFLASFPGAQPDPLVTPKLNVSIRTFIYYIVRIANCSYFSELLETIDICEDNRFGKNMGEIRVLENLVTTNFKEGGRNEMERTFHKVVAILQEIEVEFAIGGALALGIHGKPRATNDIDILVKYDERRTVLNSFKKRSFKVKEVNDYLVKIEDADRVGVDFLFGVADPEESAIEMACKETIFGITVPVVNSEFMLWMYLLSPLRRHEADAINLINHADLDLEKLMEYQENAGDSDLFDKLQGLIDQANVEAGAKYSPRRKK